MVETKLTRPEDARDLRLAYLEERLRAQIMARGLVRRMLTRLAHESHVPTQTLRDLGRELAEGVEATDVRGFVAAFSAMDLGAIGVETAEAERHRFSGHGLIEETPGAAHPTCYLTLGYLEGAVARLTGRASLGTELACCSQGHDQCRFVVDARPQRNGSSAR